MWGLQMTCVVSSFGLFKAAVLISRRVNILVVHATKLQLLSSVIILYLDFAFKI